MERDAIGKIFDLYAPALFNYAVRTGSDPLQADNIVGDVFAKLLDQLACGNGPRLNLRSYLFQCTYHLIVDEARYSNRRISLDGDLFLEDRGPAASDAVEKRILVQKIQRAIQNDLSVNQRHVIVLRFLEGFSLRETAAILGKSINLVKATQNRAIAALRKSLSRQVVI